MSCQKTVVDFSLMSDQEILQYISNSHSQVCGRFDNDQLNRLYTEEPIRRNLSWRYAWKMLVATFLVGSSAKETQARQGEVAVVRNKDTAQKPSIITIPAQKMVGEKMVTGTVRERESGLAIPGASVMVQGTIIGTACDTAGNFRLLVPVADSVTLEISSIGFTKMSVILEASALDTIQTINLHRVDLEIVTVGMVATVVKVRKRDKIKRQVQEWLPTKKEVNAYPNPVIPGNNINVNLNLKEPGDYKAELMDLNGKRVWAQCLTHVQKNQQINIPTESAWSKGVYWLRITNNKKKVYTAKVLLQ